MEKFNLRMIE